MREIIVCVKLKLITKTKKKLRFTAKTWSKNVANEARKKKEIEGKLNKIKYRKFKWNGKTSKPGNKTRNLLRFPTKTFNHNSFS